VPKPEGWNTLTRICVGAVVARHERGVSILLGHRAATRTFFPNVWDLPGGHCEPGESCEQALVRELQEEIGITPTAWRPLGDLNATEPGSDESVVLHLYAIIEWIGEPVNMALHEHDELAWFSVDDACKLVLAHPEYPHWFRRLARDGWLPDPT
jgi:8-oxo-dGTP diphosphatase